MKFLIRILDSGASTHVTGRSEFASYAPHPSTHKEMIQTANGTYQPIIGVGSEMHSVYYTAFSLICSIIYGEFGLYELLG
jgi:hypothetical protein